MSGIYIPIDNNYEKPSQSVKIQSYNCPNCGAPLKFSISRCAYCLSEFKLDIESNKKLNNIAGFNMINCSGTFY